MIRQYYAARSRGGPNPLRVGIIAVGSIYYLQDEGYFRDRHGGAPICRTPWMVEAFLNGVLAAACRNPQTDRWEDRFMSGRSNMAVVRSLRDGRTRSISVRMLIIHDDEGLSKLPTAYPELPDVVRFYRLKPPRQVGEDERMKDRPVICRPPAQRVGPRHARPPMRAARGSGPAARAAPYARADGS